jgi:hypothetical protein
MLPYSCYHSSFLFMGSRVLLKILPCALSTNPLSVQSFKAYHDYNDTIVTWLVSLTAPSRCSSLNNFATGMTENIYLTVLYYCLRMIVDAPWYVPNTVIWKDFQIPTVKGENRCYSSQYSAWLSAHLNGLAVHLMELPDIRRERRHLPNDLPTRLLV